FNERLCGTCRSKRTAAAFTRPFSRHSGGRLDTNPRWPHRRPGRTSARPARRARSDPGDLAFLERLDHVAGLEVLIVLEADTALEAVAHLAHVVLEAPQRGDLALPDDRAVAQEAHLGTTGDDATRDVATRDLADARHREDLSHLGIAGDDLFVLGLEHPDQRVAHVVEHAVDDLVGADLDAFALADLAGLALGPHVEADHRRVRDGGEVEVGGGDATDAAVHERQ